MSAVWLNFLCHISKPDLPIPKGEKSGGGLKKAGDV